MKRFIVETFAIYETKIGFIEIGYDGDDILSINKVLNLPIENYGVKTPLTDKVYAQLVDFFDGNLKEFDFPYRLIGTEFQIKAWNALCTIPYGETRTYKDMAIAVGNEKACRAIGLANNKNPIAFAIPCHRVIGANGKLVGYAGGLDLKEFLLEMERKNKG